MSRPPWGRVSWWTSFRSARKCEITACLRARYCIREVKNENETAETARHRRVERGVRRRRQRPGRELPGIDCRKRLGIAPRVGEGGVELSRGQKHARQNRRRRHSARTFERSIHRHDRSEEHTS